MVVRHVPPLLATLRYGAGTIYVKLRQEGLVVNHTPGDRIYAEARLQVRRRRRKPGAAGRPSAAGAARTAQRRVVGGLVCDRTAHGRVLKCLTIVVGATHEAVTTTARAIGGSRSHASSKTLTWPRAVACDACCAPTTNADVESFIAASATSASPSTGSRAYATPMRSSRHGAMSTTGRDRREGLGGLTPAASRRR